MSLTSKSPKYIIWLNRIDSYVEEGSGKPSLFSSEREARKCAKELWPKIPWTIRQFSYIKRSKKRQDKAAREYEKEVGTMVNSQGFQYRFKPPIQSKPVCVFLFDTGKERQPPTKSFATLAAARKWATTAAKKFITVKYPDREISILDCSDTNLPVWTDTIFLPEETQDGTETSVRPVIVKGEDVDLSGAGKIMPTPHKNAEGNWVCPITGKVYQALGKQLLIHIRKAAARQPERYLPVMDWMAFNNGDGWVCPYTGKVFKRIGKHLDLHLSKQRKLL